MLDEVALPRPEKVAEWGRTARFLVVASGPWWRRIIAQILSKEYRAAKRALGNPGALSLAPDKLSNLKERASALDSGFAALAKVVGINDLDRVAGLRFVRGAESNDIHPHRGREPSPYPRA